MFTASDLVASGDEESIINSVDEEATFDQTEHKKASSRSKKL